MEVVYYTMTRDEKLIYFENSECKKSWVGAPSTSTARSNRFDRKTMLCVWWDQRSVVYYELSKPGQTVNTKRYQQQLTDLNRSLLEKSPKYRKRQHKVIFLRDTTPSHTAKPIRDTLETLSWEVLPPCGLPTRLGSFRLPLVCIDDFTHLLSSALVRTNMWKNGLMNGSQQKRKIFIVVVLFTSFPKDGENVWQAMGHTLNKALLIILPNLTCFVRKNPHFILVYWYNQKLDE